MPKNLENRILKKRWRLGKSIGSGGCAEVYEATDLTDESAGAALVAKVASLPVGLPPAINKGKKRKKTDAEKHADMLYYEYTVYNGYLRKHDGVPQVPHGGYGDDKDVRFLIMTRLGSDVQSACENNGTWTVSQKAGYARQMLSLLRVLHEECKMVFVDVKPENFMFGRTGGPDEHKIFLIDFGLSSRYTGAGGAIKPQKETGQVAGTPEFLSIKCHAGAGAGRCDDLESLGYVIVAILKGGDSPLPWSGATSVESGLAKKKSTTIQELCSGTPPQMIQYMERVRDMSYDETPDYSALDSMLKAMSGASAKDGSGGQKSKTRGKQRPPATNSQDASSSQDEAQVNNRTKATRRRQAKIGAGESGKLTRTRTLASKEGKNPASTGTSSSSTLDEDKHFVDARDDDDVVETCPQPRRSERTVATKRRRKDTDLDADSADERAARAFVIKVSGGPHAAQTLRLHVGGAEARVGRNAPRRNGLRLDKDLEVSDRHAVLKGTLEGLMCEDVGSTNGTYVNEDRMSRPTLLKDGDVLQMGQSVMLISEERNR